MTTLQTKNIYKDMMEEILKLARNLKIKMEMNYLNIEKSLNRENKLRCKKARTEFQSCYER